MSIVACVQIKMARSALGWSTQKLSDESGVSARTLNRIETNEGFVSATAANLKLVEMTLQAAGIEFIGDAFYKKSYFGVGLVNFPSPSTYKT